MTDFDPERTDIIPGLRPHDTPPMPLPVASHRRRRRGVRVSRAATVAVFGAPVAAVALTVGLLAPAWVAGDAAPPAAASPSPAGPLAMEPPPDLPSPSPSRADRSRPRVTDEPAVTPTPTASSPSPTPEPSTARPSPSPTAPTGPPSPTTGPPVIDLPVPESPSPSPEESPMDDTPTPTPAAAASTEDGCLAVVAQSCPRGVHRDWWAEVDAGAGPLGCPWCVIEDLQVAVEQRTAGVS